MQEIIRLIEQHGLDRDLLKNPYTDVSGSEVRRKWQEVQKAVPTRDTQLQQEQARQQSKKQILILFLATFPSEKEHWFVETNTCHVIQYYTLVTIAHTPLLLHFDGRAQVLYLIFLVVFRQREIAMFICGEVERRGTLVGGSVGAGGADRIGRKGEPRTGCQKAPGYLQSGRIF